MMNDVQNTAQEKSVLRWGGLAGMVGGIIFILVFVIVGVFVGMEFVAVVGVFALIIFHLVLGWKVYRLSRVPSGVLKIEQRVGALKTMQEGRVDAPAPFERT